MTFKVVLTFLKYTIFSVLWVYLPIILNAIVKKLQFCYFVKKKLFLINRNKNIAQYTAKKMINFFAYSQKDILIKYAEYLHRFK